MGLHAAAAKLTDRIHEALQDDARSLRGDHLEIVAGNLEIHHVTAQLCRKPLQETGRGGLGRTVRTALPVRGHRVAVRGGVRMAASQRRRGRRLGGRGGRAGRDSILRREVGNGRNRGRRAMRSRARSGVQAFRLRARSAGKQLVPAHAQVQDVVHESRRADDIPCANQVGRRQFAAGKGSAVEQPVHAVGDGPARHGHDHGVHRQCEGDLRFGSEPGQEQGQRHRRVTDQQAERTVHATEGQTSVPAQCVSGAERSNKGRQDDQTTADAEYQHEHARCHEFPIREPHLGVRFSYTNVGAVHSFSPIVLGVASVSNQPMGISPFREMVVLSGRNRFPTRKISAVRASQDRVLGVHFVPSVSQRPRRESARFTSLRCSRGRLRNVHYNTGKGSACPPWDDYLISPTARRQQHGSSGSSRQQRQQPDVLAASPVSA